ncbi:MAG: very short patch repair endonuclease [Dehalogenimonas sp.]
MPDNLSPVQRSYCMSRVKGKDTGIEKQVRTALHRLGLRYRIHKKDLVGKPDIAFIKPRVLIFIDGDFWHGYRFPVWKDKLSPFWQEKISKTRKRDVENFKLLRRDGWKVIRIWQHELKSNFQSCISRIVSAVNNSEEKPD